METLALIPARVGSKGVASKNFRRLPDGSSLVARAVYCAQRAGLTPVISTDLVVESPVPYPYLNVPAGHALEGAYRLDCVTIGRPPEAATDAAPMHAVITHAIQRLGLDPDQIVALLQPTSPLRSPQYVSEAVELLESSEILSSVVTVVEVPKHYSPERLCRVQEDGTLMPWSGDWADEVTRRQDARQAYLRDGTVYVFRVGQFQHFGHLYGAHCEYMIVSARDSLTIDTESDWDRLVEMCEGRLPDLSVRIMGECRE